MIRGLPYDAELEYLESTGTQYIDTGVKPSNDLRTKFRATYTHTPIENNSTIFGSRSTASSNDRYWLNYDSKFEVGYGSYSNTGVTVSPGEMFDVDFNYIENGDHKFKINDSVSTYSGTPNTTIGIILFGRIVGAQVTRCSSRFYSAQFFRNGTLILDLIPVRVGSGASAVGYMYDRVSKRLFGNAGSGAFVLGPDKAVPILSLHRYAAPIVTEWVDGRCWDTFGVDTALAGASRCDNFIPVQPSSTVTFYFGNRPGGMTLYMVQYGSDKLRVNSTYNSNGSARTVTIPANCYYIRISCETANKANVYVHDDTNDKYLMKDGRVLVADATGRTALGKMGAGANLVFNEEDYIMTTQLTITENCRNMATATTHIQTLLNASGIDADAIGFIKLHSESPRNNALLAASFMMRTMPSGVSSRLRLRSGVIQLVNADSNYDADVQVGDVYDVYVLKNTEGWEQ